MKKRKKKGSLWFQFIRKDFVTLPASLKRFPRLFCFGLRCFHAGRSLHRLIYFCVLPKLENYKYFVKKKRKNVRNTKELFFRDNSDW